MHDVSVGIMSLMSLTRTIWRGTNNCYGSVRNISWIKGSSLYSGEVTTPVISPDVDILYQNLKTASSSTSVLKLINEHHKIMNTNHALQALTSIFTLQKEGKTDLSTKQLLNNRDFEKLCKKLKMNAGTIDIKDAIQALKVISYVGVPTTSTITQVLLQLIRQNINFLNLQQIIFLDFLIRGFASTPLVDALKIALPLVFEINLPKKMDRQNPVHMADCLHYATRVGVSQNITDLIMSCLEEYPGEFYGKTAKSIIMSICAMDRNPSCEKLLTKTTNDLIVNLDDISVIDMEILLNKLAHKYTKFFTFYHQEIFFDSCANYVVENNIELKRAVGVLRNSARVHHFNKSLIDYVSTLIHKDPPKERDPSTIYSIVISLVLTDYKPVHWNSLKNWIKTSKDLASYNKKEIIWIRFAAALCILDIYKIDVLSRALQPSYVSHLLDKGFMSDFENYFTIWQCISTYKPDLIDLLPTNLDPEKCVQKWTHPEEYPLETAFQTGLGGKQYLLTNVYSKLGVLIDHAIVIKNDGSPITLDKNVKFVEDIELDSNNHLILILGLREHQYTSNTKMMRANIINSIQVLEQKLNCHVIPVNLMSWEELNDFERIPYLMQKIRSKLELNINISESAV